MTGKRPRLMSAARRTVTESKGGRPCGIRCAGGCDAANHRKNLKSAIVALDGPLPNGCKGGAILDMRGDNWIHQS